MRSAKNADSSRTIFWIGSGVRRRGFDIEIAQLRDRLRLGDVKSDQPGHGSVQRTHFAVGPVEGLHLCESAIHEEFRSRDCSCCHRKRETQRLSRSRRVCRTYRAERHWKSSSFFARPHPTRLLTPMTSGSSISRRMARPCFCHAAGSAARASSRNDAMRPPFFAIFLTAAIGAGRAVIRRPRLLEFEEMIAPRVKVDEKSCRRELIAVADIAFPGQCLHQAPGPAAQVVPRQPAPSPANGDQRGSPPPASARPLVARSRQRCCESSHYRASRDARTDAIRRRGTDPGSVPRITRPSAFATLS
jgi:hypothetical protein